MHRTTVWTLLLALLLQLLAASAGAVRAPQSAQACHAVVQHSVSAMADHHGHSAQADDASATGSLQMDGHHHCCAVGLGAGACSGVQALPQARHEQPHGPWLSQSLSPDLRPPIGTVSFACL